MARITHHDLRHLFAMRCIESGVDVPTVSRWLGGLVNETSLAISFECASRKCP
jgi:site-specific recombinase XerD